jgi:hypothetical protein
MKATVDGVSYVNIYLCTMCEWTTDAVLTLPMLHCAHFRREEKERLRADRIISIRIESSNGPGRWMNE